MKQSHLHLPTTTAVCTLHKLNRSNITPQRLHLQNQRLRLEMGQTGERCRALEGHIYWTEFAPNRHQFFKLMMGDFRNQLRIPRKFISHFKEELLGTVRLIGPSRNVWNVNIARTDDDIIFQIGWGKFVQDHSLAERDFLVFHYIGYSSFNVSIFDETGCEREGAFFVKKHISCNRNACFLQNEEENILQTTGVEEMKGRDGASGEVRERNLKSKTCMLVGTRFEAKNSDMETFGAGKEDREGNTAQETEFVDLTSSRKELKIRPHRRKQVK